MSSIIIWIYINIFFNIYIYIKNCQVIIKKNKIIKKIIKKIFYFKNILKYIINNFNHVILIGTIHIF